MCDCAAAADAINRIATTPAASLAATDRREVRSMSGEDQCIQPAQGMTRKRPRPARPASPPPSPAPPVASPPRRFAVDALVIAAVALLLRLVHVYQMQDTLFFSVLMGDSRGYDTWAREIASGDWLGREVFYQAPLYPYFLGTLYSLFGRDLLMVRLVQAGLGALSCVALGYAVRQLIGRQAGLVAGLMLALYAPAIFFDGLMQKSVLDVVFMTVSLALVARLACADPGPRLWFALGGALGALSLTRENALGLVVVVIAWSLLADRSPRTTAVGESSRGVLTRIAPMVAVLAGLAVVLTPVLVRNYRVGGSFHLTTSQFGTNLFIGNNAAADGSYVALRAGRGSPEYERVDATALAEQATGRTLTPGEVSDYWLGRTWDFITSQPAAWLRLMAHKVRLLASRTEVIDTESQESHAEYSWPLRALGSVWHFGIALPLAVLGAFVLWPERRRLWVLYAMAAGYALSVIAFFVVARYRHPLVPLLLPFSAAGAIAIVSSFRRERRAPVAAFAFAAVAAVVANWPLSLSGSAKAITENNLATALQEDGRLDEAIDRYKRALAFDATYAPALNNLGTALRAAGRLDEAVAIYGQALSSSSDAANVHYNLGNALMARGDAAGAIVAFRAALAASPRFVEAMNNLGQALEAAGQRGQAIDAFRQVLALDERSAMAHSNLANALASAGAVREAAPHFERAAALEPGNAAIRYDYGSMLIEAGLFDAAASELRRAIAIKPDYAEAYNNLGIALASQGRLSEAITQWQEAVRLKPDFIDARQNLERARRK